jgi:hypothetical protein
MDNLKDKGPRDKSRISLDEAWEVKYWSQKFGVDTAELHKAVGAVGNSADAVHKYISENNIGNGKQ